MKVKVTKTHINKGQPSQADSCPIALAIASHCHLAQKRVSVLGYDEIRIRNKFYAMKNNKNFITRFDDGLYVNPFTAVLVPYI